MDAEKHSDRVIGLFGATGVGVGAIVGGGILALAGSAFAATGPSAVIAFALNGSIALLTALSFAEVASKFPESGGTYTFAKKVLSVEAAFTVGWVVWFASIVAGALYAMGFGEFAIAATVELFRSTGREVPSWLDTRLTVIVLAVLSVAYYMIILLRKSSGGGQWANIGKVLLFAFLIFAGLWAMRDRTPASLASSIRPFFADGSIGLIQAMGFTFIALQGFDLIAAVGGEIREPTRVIPRAMFLSLGIALLIYLPLLMVIATVGMVPGETVTAVSRRDPETIVAVAAANYLGPFGFWLVMMAGLLSMLSALKANLFAASRVAMSMARDRTLPRTVAYVEPKSKSPRTAILLTAGIVVVIVVIVPDLAAAGAAASLIFLITFALTHWIAILVRQRSGSHLPPFRAPLFPVVPIFGGLACLALAVFQGIAVPSAGGITMSWLSIGGLLFLLLFARKARIVDASHSAMDPELMRMRGRSPLVLVPIANPDNAPGLLEVARALTPPSVGRVVTLSVCVAPDGWKPEQFSKPLEDIKQVVGETIVAAAVSGEFPDVLATVASDPWREITRVARRHRCESMLLGLSQLSEADVSTPLDQLLGAVDCDVVVLRSPKGWHLDQARRILVPTGGRGGHDQLLARLLASLLRSDQREVKFVKVLGENASPAQQKSTEAELYAIADNLCPGQGEVHTFLNDSPVDVLATESTHHDLMVLGAQRVNRRKKFFGQFALQVALKTEIPLLLICRRG